MAHWYSSDGTLHTSIEYSDPKRKGQYRDMDLGDARKLGYLPGVTTVLGILSKPGLVNWQMEQVAKAAWFKPIDVENLEDIDREWIKSTILKSQEYTNWTADFGSAVHWWVNKKLRSVQTFELPPLFPNAEEVADGLIGWLSVNGYDFSLTEHRFARRDLGYAGTVDLIGTRHGEPVICDIKTQEPPLTPYAPEYPLQLAAYDYAVSEESRLRISIIANRLNPGEVKEHIWVKDNNLEATNIYYDRMWLTLLNLWFQLNNYDPRKWEEE